MNVDSPSLDWYDRATSKNSRSNNAVPCESDDLLSLEFPSEISNHLRRNSCDCYAMLRDKASFSSMLCDESRSTNYETSRSIWYCDELDASSSDDEPKYWTIEWKAKLLSREWHYPITTLFEKTCPSFEYTCRTWENKLVIIVEIIQIGYFNLLTDIQQRMLLLLLLLIIMG